MMRMLQAVSAVGLCLTVIPAFLVWYGAISWVLHVQMMFAGMVMWFGTAPFWMNREKSV
ncbi:hypothetical protein LLG96_09610 [bacterium]|nr:hypothetical protein [bacterium]